MWIDVTEGNAWDIKKFAGTFISSDHEQTCIINNDSIIGYEIRRGAITIPSGIVSTHRRGNLSFLLLTMGYDLSTHETIGKSIKNLKPITETPDNTSSLGLAEPAPTADTTSNTSIKYDSQETELLNYDGEYLSLKYPSNWVVDEHCSDLTADVYIGNSTKQIGLWIFKFDMPEDMNWNDAMESIASSWREYASVDVGNVMFKGNGWCKHDILLEIPDLTQRQISFYCHRGGYIYNIKFGNDVSSVRNNENLISEIMSSVQIK